MNGALPEPWRHANKEDTYVLSLFGNLQVSLPDLLGMTDSEILDAVINEWRYTAVELEKEVIRRVSELVACYRVAARK